MSGEERKNRKETDEIGGELENGSEVNEVIEQQGEDAAAGVLRGDDAAKHEQEQTATNEGDGRKLNETA